MAKGQCYNFKMKYINFGRTGVKVSQLCLGCMNFGGRQNESESIRIIHQAIDAGINYLDTANVYGHEPLEFEVGRGRSEQIIGKALKSKRENIFLATKVHYEMGSDVNAQGNSRRHIIEQCEASLKRLDTDYIDLYQLHGTNNDIPIDESLRALDDLIRAGKVRYIGTSGFAAWELIEALWVADKNHLNRFVSEQAPYNLLDRRIERELIPALQTYNTKLPKAHGTKPFGVAFIEKVLIKKKMSSTFKKLCLRWQKKKMFQAMHLLWHGA